MTGNSLNFNTSTYKKDTNSAMKMSGPIWNDFFPLFLNILYTITQIYIHISKWIQQRTNFNSKIYNRKDNSINNRDNHSKNKIKAQQTMKNRIKIILYILIMTLHNWLKVK